MKACCRRSRARTKPAEGQCPDREPRVLSCRVRSRRALFPSCPHIVMPGLVPGISRHRFRRTAAWMPGTSPGMTEGGRPTVTAYRIHTSLPGGAALYYPNRRPGPRAGAQPRFSRQPRIAVRGRPWRSGLLSTGCGGIGSQGRVPAFAGTTKRGRKPAQQGQQARRRQAGMRGVHAVAVTAEALGRRGPAPGSGSCELRNRGPSDGAPARRRDRWRLHDGEPGAGLCARPRLRRAAGAPGR